MNTDGHGLGGRGDTNCTNFSRIPKGGWNRSNEEKTKGKHSYLRFSEGQINHQVLELKACRMRLRNSLVALGACEFFLAMSTLQDVAPKAFAHRPPAVCECANTPQ